MRIIKLILPFVLIFALSLPTYAMHLTENKVVDRELTVEEDENVVDKSINGTPQKRPTKTFVMSRPVYLKIIILPFILLFMLGPLYLAAEYEIKKKIKSHSH